jgi:leishmanolysin-like peptidase
MSHVFAVDWLLFTLFRDPVTNQPLTTRDQFGYPPYYDGIGYVADDTTVQFFKERDVVTAKLVTPHALEHARKHFDCPTLNGVELENQGSEGSALSHTEARIFLGDIMNPELNPGATGKYSEISLAIFEDSGWYKVNYSHSTPIAWGKNKGCAFATQKCLKDQKPKPVSVAPDHFCTKQYERKCMVGHESKGVCVLTNSHTEHTPIPEPFRYFNKSMGGTSESKYVGGWVTSADFCPVYMQDYTTDFKQAQDCRFTNTHVDTTYTGELYGTGSMCVESDVIHVSKYANKKAQPLSKTRCFKTECQVDQRGKMSLTVHVGDKSVSCGASGGQDITFDDDVFYGKLTCPLVSEVCGNAPCLNNCNNMGRCVNGACVCSPGFYGDDCSQWT